MTFNERKIPNSPEYQRQHRWVKRELGKAYYCSNDSRHESTRFDWSNISKDYKYSLSDWRQLCRKCHRSYDPITDAGRKRISAANKVNSLGNTYANKPILMVHANGSWIKYASSEIASAVSGIKSTNISNALNGWTKTAGGYQWRRVGG